MRMKSAGKYCKNCICKEGDAGITLDTEGVCNICNGDKYENSIGKLRQAIKNCNRFEAEAGKRRDGGYDCLLMLSGGKDSIYMLKKLVNENKLRILAFTVNLPFESRNSLENVGKAVGKLGVEHVSYSPNIIAYKKLMKTVFSLNNESIAEKMKQFDFNHEKLPCLTCGSYIKIVSYLFACKMKIPYVLFCADPAQMATMDYRMEEVIEKFVKICGEQLTQELFGDELELLQKKAPDELPQLVYPYATMDHYNACKIMAELKEADLYGTSREETHCALFPLLHYFAIKKFDCTFYTDEVASDVRAGTLNRETALDSIEKFKELILSAATEEGCKQTTENMASILKPVFCKSDPGLEYQYNSIRSLKKIAEELDIDLACM